MTAPRTVDVASGVVQTIAGAPAKLTVDADGNLKIVISGGGGGGGGIVTQGAQDASAEPWAVYIADPSDGTPWLGATETSLTNLQELVSKESTLQALNNKLPAAVDLSGTLAGAYTTAILGAVMLARNEDSNRLERLSMDASIRALNVRAYMRSLNGAAYGSWNGSANVAAWGRKINVTGSAQVGKIVVTNKGASEAWLFIKDKSGVLATSDLPTLAPRKVAAGATVEVHFGHPLPVSFTGGIQAGLSTTAADYQEIAADDAWFEVHRMQ